MKIERWCDVAIKEFLSAFQSFDCTGEWKRDGLLYYFMKGKNFLRPAMKDAIAQQSVFGIIEAAK
ncbi:MAG: hypothetical protein CME22_05235 [Gemmatimonadetes bacterium]|nr:hypothetical protein [Gemmatimonadota bacterium]